MMLLKALALICVAVSATLVSGAPRFTNKRAARSALRSSDLHTRIHELVSAQEHHKASKGEAQDDDEENDVSRVNRLRGVSEAQMTSERQKQVQMLSTQLDARTQADLHELAETLDQLLRETTPQKSSMDRTNTAGEYLGFKFNKKSDEDEEERASSKELKSQEEDVHMRQKAGLKSVAREEEEEGEGEEEEEGDDDELQTIYDIVLKMYNQQHQKAKREEEEEEEGGVPRKREEEEEEGDFPRKREEEEEEGDVPRKKASAQRVTRPDYLVDEGTFGEFVDTGEDALPSASTHYTEQLRKKVLTAIESRLMQDLRDAQDVGISVDDIIHDVQGKARKEEHLRHIERQLDRLTSRD